MSDFHAVSSCTDAFGEEVRVGDEVHFKSYEHISRGVITEILKNDRALQPKYEWLIHISRTFIHNFGKRVEAEQATVRSLRQIAKITRSEA